MDYLVQSAMHNEVHGIAPTSEFNGQDTNLELCNGSAFIEIADSPPTKKALLEPKLISASSVHAEGGLVSSNAPDLSDSSKHPSPKIPPLLSTAVPFVPFEIRKQFRSQYELSVKSSVDGLLKGLDTYEHTITKLIQEANLLTSRVRKLEKCSSKLKKVMTTNTSLPQPTEDKRGRRIPSSQVPRFAPTLTAIPEPTSITPSADAFSTAVSEPSTTVEVISPKSSTIATANNNTVESAKVSTSPSTAFSSTSKVVCVRVGDVIDLTADPNAQTSFARPPCSNTLLENLVQQIPTSTSPSVNYTQLEAASAVPLPSSVPSSKRRGRPSEPLTTSDTVQQNKGANCISAAVAYANKLATAPDPYKNIATAMAPLLTKAPRFIVPNNIIPVMPVQPPLQLLITPADEGICLKWELGGTTTSFEAATAYELYSFASSSMEPSPMLNSEAWQKVGDVVALPLPMACTLTSVLPNNVYYFIVRSKDRYNRCSEWSNVANAYVT